MNKKKLPSVNRATVMQHLIEYQLNMVGKTIVDTVDDDRWFFNWTMTTTQQDEFRDYAIPLLQKVFKFNKRKAVSTFNWFIKNFGLRIKNG